MATFTKYKNKSGEFYEYRFVYKDPITGKRKEKSQKGFKRKGDAQAACKEAEKSLKDGFAEENILLKDYLDYWLNSHKKGIIRDSTYENKEQQIRLHILPYFQNIELNNIKHMLYQKFIDQMAEKGYAKCTILISHSILFSVFERAILEKKMKDNPAKGATIKGKEKSKEDLEYVPSSQVNELMMEAYRNSFEYYVFFRTLLETGMRKGEATGLTWENVDFEKNRIIISKAMDTQKGNFTKTKTVSSKRTIPVPMRLMEELKKLRKRQNENRFAHNLNYDFEMNLVFCRPNGKFYPKSTLFNAFQRYQKKTGIFAGVDEKGNPKCYSIHSLRHTHAVICLENDMDMKTLQERLGHGSYEVTADVYSHVSDKMKQKTMEKYEEGTANILPIIKIEGIYN